MPRNLAAFASGVKTPEFPLLFGKAEEAREDDLVRHSEQSEESLFCGNPRKEGFIAPTACDAKPSLTSRTPFGMTGWCFFLQAVKLRPPENHF